MQTVVTIPIASSSSESGDTVDTKAKEAALQSPVLTKVKQLPMPKKEGVSVPPLMARRASSISLVAATAVGTAAAIPDEEIFSPTYSVDVGTKILNRLY